jgi:hypothetical protein
MFMKLIKTLLAIGMTLAVAMPVSAQIAYTPIHFREDSGIRPFIDVKMNGRSFQLMVHSSAEFYMMTDHAIAESIGVTNLKKTEDYGIDSPGHVSALGKAVSVLKTLEVAGREQGDVPVDVFETPNPDMEGMLGIRWLRSQLVIVDYDSYRVGIPRTIHDSEKEDERLIGLGFQKLKMTWDARSERYFVTGTINGVAGRFIVSTVSHDFLDPAFAKHAGVEVGPVIGDGHGPTGTSTDELLAKRQITLTIDGRQTAGDQPRIMDLYAYAGVKAPSNPAERIDGTIGTDFMLANQAVIDFGTESLFIRK